MRLRFVLGMMLLLATVLGCAKTPPPVVAPAPPAAPGPAAPPAAPPAQAKDGCTRPPTPPVPGPGQMLVWAYFSCEADWVDLGPPRAVARLVPATQGVLLAALTELLKGPTPAERGLGYYSWFSAETAGMLKSVSLSPEGLAVADFRDFSRIIPNASTSAGSRDLLLSLGHTMAQFPSVRAMTFRFDGDCMAFSGWLQRDCIHLDAAKFR